MSEFVHVLPSVRNHPWAPVDAVLIKPFLDELERMQSIYPVEVDEIFEAITVVRSHDYLYHEYLLDLSSDLMHLRAVCLEHTKENRSVHLEVTKKLGAVYRSLI